MPVASLSIVGDQRVASRLECDEDAASFQEHLFAEYVLARASRGVSDTSIRSELSAVEEFLAFAGVWAWEIEPAHADRFLGKAQRKQAPATRRGKATKIDIFFRFLELRYQRELLELTGKHVSSPIDDANRPAL
jgi:hypothetical protein